MNLGVNLKAAEKVFGPALPGATTPECTLSALRFSSTKKGVFGGVVGIQPNAQFYIHFPIPVDWKGLETKKGIPDFVNDLKESGPQGEQGRHDLVAKFLEERKRESVAQTEKERLEEEKQVMSKKLLECIGEWPVTLVVNGISLNLPKAKIALDKKGKLTLSSSI